MKTRALVMAGLVALTLMVSTRVARAQEAVIVNIPFSFVAGSTALPAGEYSVKTVGAQGALLVIQRTNGPASAMMNTNAAVASEPQSESKLIFNRYGERYFLSQVWTAGNPRGRELLKSAREKEIAQVAKLENDYGHVTLVASLPQTHPSN